MKRERPLRLRAGRRAGGDQAREARGRGDPQTQTVSTGSRDRQQVPGGRVEHRCSQRMLRILQGRG